MKRLPTILWIGFLSLCLADTAAWAQATAELNGQVTDTSSAVQPKIFANGMALCCTLITDQQ